MDFSNFKFDGKAALDGIKNRLGLSPENGDYADDYGDDYVDPYASDYEDPYAQSEPARAPRAEVRFQKPSAFDDPYDDATYAEFAEYGRSYDENAPVPAPSAQSAAPEPARAPAHAKLVPSLPKLVSFDDVRALARSRTTHAYVDRPNPVVENAPASDQEALSFHNERSESLDSLFGGAPSASPRASSASRPLSASEFAANGPAMPAFLANMSPEPVAAPEPAPRQAPAVSSSDASYDPYDAYEGKTTASFGGTRSCVVIRPAVYGDVEQVARALKAGDAVALCLRDTPDALSKRVLDFSFGVATALDASVDCISEKLFAITRGSGLSDAEFEALHRDGIL